MKIRPIGAELFHANRRADGRTDKRTGRQTDRYDEANSLDTQFVERAKCS